MGQYMVEHWMKLVPEILKVYTERYEFGGDERKEGCLRMRGGEAVYLD